MGIRKDADTEKYTPKNTPKVRIDENTAFWMNKTKSGKGVIIVIDDQAFISSLTNVQEFAEDKRRGVRFNLLKSVEDD